MIRIALSGHLRLGAILAPVFLRALTLPMGCLLTDLYGHENSKFLCSSPPEALIPSRCLLDSEKTGQDSDH